MGKKYWAIEENTYGQLFSTPLSVEGKFDLRYSTSASFRFIKFHRETTKSTSQRFEDDASFFSLFTFQDVTCPRLCNSLASCIVFIHFHSYCILIIYTWVESVFFPYKTFHFWTQRIPRRLERMACTCTRQFYVLELSRTSLLFFFK